LKEPTKKITSVGLIGNPEKASCVGVLKQAETLIRAARRKVFCDAITGQWAGIKGSVCPDAATLARRVDLLL